MRIRSSVLAGFGVGFATVAAQNNTTECHNYVILSTRGTYERQGPSIGFGRMIAWTIGNLTGGAERDTVYPAEQNQTYYFGANDVVQYIDSAIESCPNQKYALLGYSQGASVTGAALHNYTNTDSPGYKAIKAVLVIGNPYKIPNKDSDVNQDGGTSNRDIRGGLHNETGPDAYGNGIPDLFYADGKLLDICYDKDPICAIGMKDANVDAHGLYGASDSVQEMGAKFLISKLSARNTTSTTTGGGASTTSAITILGKSGAVMGKQLPTYMFAMVLALTIGIAAI